MDRIREQLNKPIVIAVLGGVVGLILGWFVIGWWLWPVEWFDAAPKDLRKDVQADYLRMTIESYAKNGNKQLAQQRWQDLGDNAKDLLAQIQINPQDVTPGDIAKFNGLVMGGAAPAPAVTPKATTAPGEPTAVAPAGGTVTAAPASTPAASSSGFPLSLALGILCLLMLVIAGALVYIFVFRKRKTGSAGFATAASQAAEANRQAVRTEYTALGQEPPVAQFMTTYNVGDDLYDDSFSIDAPSGEFLGECGVGISETVGVGDPKKVTAFEVWLFDKNDIQTITKVLMSEFAFNDAAIRQRLASKGEPVMIDSGQRILLETATLQLEARVVDMTYGQGPLPAGSYFDRLTLELSIWPKPAAA